jgi:hypothetical protein
MRYYEENGELDELENVKTELVTEPRATTKPENSHRLR